MLKLLITVVFTTLTIVTVIPIVIGVGMWSVNQYGGYGYALFSGVCLVICGNLNKLID